MSKKRRNRNKQIDQAIEQVIRNEENLAAAEEAAVEEEAAMDETAAEVTEETVAEAVEAEEAVDAYDAVETEDAAMEEEAPLNEDEDFAADEAVETEEAIAVEEVVVPEESEVAMEEEPAAMGEEPADPMVLSERIYLEEDSAPAATDADEKLVEEATAEDAEAAKARAKEEAVRKAQEARRKAAGNSGKTHQERTQETAMALQKDAKREARRKRRVRNQTISVIAVLLFFCAIAAGGFFLVRYVKNTFFAEKPEAVTTQVEETIPQESEELIEDMLGEEEVLEEPELVEEEPEPTPEEILDEIVNKTIQDMSLEDKVAGLFFVTPEGITGVNAAIKAGNGTKEALGKYPVGGILYSGKNIKSESQFAEMLETTLTMVTYPTFLAVTEEGGKMNTLGDKGIGSKEKSAADIAAGGDPSAAYTAGSNLAATMTGLKLDVDFGPVADLGSVDGNVLGARSYGSDAATVSPYVENMMKGLQEGGVTACLKYFPGLGSTKDNPAKGRAISERSAEDYKLNEFVVYQNAIANGATMIMMSNLIVPSLDADSNPAGLSSVIVTDILRGELGFEGVIVSGDLSEVAISDYYGSDEAAIMALKAGCDMIYNPENFEKAYQGILGAVSDGVISESRIDDALRRIYRIKYADLVPGVGESASETTEAGE